MASNLNKSEMILSVRGNLNVGYHDHIGCIDNSALGGIPYYRGVAVRNNMAVHQAAAGNHFGLPRFGMLRYNPADPPRGKVLQISWKHSQYNWGWLQQREGGSNTVSLLPYTQLLPTGLTVSSISSRFCDLTRFSYSLPLLSVSNSYFSSVFGATL